MDSMDVLERLEAGDISSDSAASLLKKNERKVNPGRGRFLKIKVRSEGSNINIVLPISLISGGLSFARFIFNLLPYADEEDDARKVMEIFRQLDGKDIKVLTDSFRMCKGMNLVEVHSNDSDVSIRVI